MGKRSSFRRLERDYYPTPAAAVAPLIPHVPPGARFWEPMAGDGALIRALADRAECVCATDIEPQAEGIYRSDAMAADRAGVDATGAELIITNPPWPRTKGQPTIGMIQHLTALRPTWVLLSHAFCANAYFGTVASSCVKIVPVGRVSWMQNGKGGKDDAAWYLFDERHIGSTRFIGRAA